MKFYILTFKLFIIRLTMNTLNRCNIVLPKILCERFYNLVTELSDMIFADFTCMNYGYDNGNDIEIIEEFKNERYPAQLYNYVATFGNRLNISNLDLLEVGSGRGGGLSYLTQSYKPKSSTGLELSPKAVAFCKTRHKAVNACFLQGNSQSIPFPDESFDIVINIESSHCYQHIQLFLNEVKRVLRKDGYFCIADFRDSHKLEDFFSELNSSGLKIVHKENITQNVLKALTLSSNDKEEFYKTINIPNIYRKTLSDFAGTIGSRKYNDFKSGIRQYYYFVLQKQKI